jgi:1-deoxyxylulose-5-phosphate synthase
MSGEDKMKVTYLGRTGVQVSKICLGTMTFGNQADEPTSRAIMDKAFDNGVFFFDTANAYPLGSTLHLARRSSWLRGR